MKLIYISRTRLDYSLNAVYLKGLRKNGVEVLSFQLSSGGIRGYFKALDFVRVNKKSTDALIIGYDSSVLAIFLRFFYGKKMIYSAVLPVYERLILSRNLAGRRSLKGMYYWLIDFLAYHLSDLTMIETNKQIEHICKFYNVSKDKFVRAWVGVDEDNFFHNPEISKYPTFTVLFRGALMPEAGAEYLVKAAKILENEDINFIMLSGGMLKDKIKELVREVGPKNLELKTRLLPYEELRNVMQKCHLSLGQLSDHQRLRRTVPHKAFESLALKLPYLTASNEGITELLKDGETCITCKPADAKSLADKILWIKNNYGVAEKIAENGYKFYKNELTPFVLAKKLIDGIS